MTTKTFHGFTLWAVPRFHRSDIVPLMPGAKADWTEKFYSYSTAPEEKSPEQNNQEKPALCH